MLQSAPPEEIAAAVLAGVVLVTIPVAAGITYLDSKRNSNKERKIEAEKDAANTSKLPSFFFYAFRCVNGKGELANALIEKGGK